MKRQTGRTGRRAADTLSAAQCQALEKDLLAWIDTERQAGRTWRFGVYGEMHESRDILKMAPDFEDLLVNRSLWKLLLSYFPSGKFKDKYLADIMNRLLENRLLLKINDTKMKDQHFVTWICKCVHASMSHIRAVALYPEKFGYRINSLPTDKRQQLEELTVLVAKEIAQEKAKKSAGSFRTSASPSASPSSRRTCLEQAPTRAGSFRTCLLYTSDAADE